MSPPSPMLELEEEEGDEVGYSYMPDCALYRGGTSSAAGGQ